MKRMNKRVQEALAELEKLPENEQEVVAEAILDFAARGGRVELSEDQANEVRRRLADPNPKFLTLAEARARLLGAGA
jgi:chromosome condensin MukBEF ATPase and DNA-binding subunit MukB